MLSVACIEQDEDDLLMLSVAYIEQDEDDLAARICVDHHMKYRCFLLRR
jgi:hypothetical protein